MLRKVLRSNTTNTTCTHHVTIDGPSVVMYRPDKPLSCGAVAWIYTESAVKVDGEII